MVISTVNGPFSIAFSMFTTQTPGWLRRKPSEPVHREAPKRSHLTAQQQLNGEAHVEEDVEAQPETRLLITLGVDPFPVKNWKKSRDGGMG